MIWVAEKRVVHHVVEVEAQRIRIPIRVKFEFEVKDGAFVPDTLSVVTLYNEAFLEAHYPYLDLPGLHRAIAETVNREIKNHLRESGFLTSETFCGSPHEL